MQMSEERDVIAKQIGNRIRERREELGMTETELACVAQLNYTTISRIENGVNLASLLNLVNIAEALKIPLSYLQPESLDTYSEIPRPLESLITKIKQMNLSDQMFLSKYFLSQAESYEDMTSTSKF